MAGKYGGQRVTPTTFCCSSKEGGSGVRRLSRWDQAWIFYDNPAYRLLKQAPASHGTTRRRCCTIVSLFIDVIYRLTFTTSTL